MHRTKRIRKTPKQTAIEWAKRSKDPDGFGVDMYGYKDDGRNEMMPVVEPEQSTSSVEKELMPVEPEQASHQFRAPMVFDLPETEHRKEITSESIPVISPATQTAISLPNFEQSAEELIEDVTFRCPFGETLPSDLSEPEGGNGDLLKPLPVSCPAVEVETSSSTLAQNPECSSGKEFDSVVQAVKDLAGMYENEDDVVRFEKPGLALRLGHNLIKVADIKFGMCLRNDDGVGTCEAETFSKLYRGEWNDLVSAVALASLKTNKFNKGDIMPLTDDLVQLKNHLSSKMATMSERIKDVPSYQTWRQLAEATMVRILLLNKRRGAEASKLLLTSYQKRPYWKETTNKEVLNSMSPLERKVFSRMDMVQTQGKMNKKVTTLLTNDMVKAVDLLITFRTQCGVNESNKYVFANQHEGHLNTWQTLRELAVQAGCKKPELINSNSLRKYIATVCQIMDLNEGEVQCRNTLSKYKGKSLEDIHVDGFEQSVVDNSKGHKQPRGKPESDFEDEQSATREMPRCKRPRLSQSRHILESDSKDFDSDNSL